MSEPVRMVVVGATGLIGRTLVERAVGKDGIRLIAIARREMPLPPGARMELLVAEPAAWGEAIAAAGAQVIVSALGTTWRAAGKDEAAFRAVDEMLVLDCARAAKASGARQCIAVSSVGAARMSRTFYLRVKGEVELALDQLKFERLDVLRPGLLKGSRGELRPAERLAALASPLTDLALHGDLRKYRSIRAAQIADAILSLAGEKPRGRFIHEHDAIVGAAHKLAG